MPSQLYNEGPLDESARRLIPLLLEKSVPATAVGWEGFFQSEETLQPFTISTSWEQVSVKKLTLGDT